VALRIKSHWHDEERERSLEEVGGALGINAWRLAKDKAINLHGEDFVYDSDAQRMAVIMEYLIFQVQIVDRLAYAVLSKEERRRLIVAMAVNTAGQVQSNSIDLFGPGDHGKAFLDRLNRRAEDYSELGLTEDGPSYPFTRLLGYEIQQIMGHEAQNRWVIDQVMDVDGPEIFKKLRRAFTDLIP
jgi:hypothetical protein